MNDPITTETYLFVHIDDVGGRMLLHTLVQTIADGYHLQYLVGDPRLVFVIGPARRLTRSRLALRLPREKRPAARLLIRRRERDVRWGRGQAGET